MVSHREHMIIAGKPVTGEHLIGRREEITAINKYLDLGQSIVLIAPRRYGKTSLLLEILKQRSGSGTVFTTPTVRLTDPLFREWLRKRVLKME